MIENSFTSLSGNMIKNKVINTRLLVFEKYMDIQYGRIVLRTRWLLETAAWARVAANSYSTHFHIKTPSTYPSALVHQPHSQT